MGRFLVIALSLLLSGCLNTGKSMSGSSNGAYQSRPSSGSEGVIGYIVKPSNITVAVNTRDAELTVSAPANSVTNGTSDTSELLVSVYNPLEPGLLDFLRSIGPAKLRADFVEGNYAEKNGSFSVKAPWRFLAPKFLMVAVEQEPGLDEVAVGNVLDFKKPTYVLMVRKDNGSYQDLVSLIQQWIDFGKNFCAKPENQNFCQAAGEPH